MGMQSCAFWDGTMLVVVLYSSTQSLTPYTSTDISTFTARTSLSLTVVHNSEGRNKSIAGAVIGGTTVLHTAESQRSSTTSHKSYHSRAQFAGTTPTWAADTILRTADSINYAQTYEGPATGIDSNKKVVQVYGWDSTLDTDFGVARYPNADAGTSWTIGSPTISDLGSTTAEISSHWFGSLGSGTYLVIADNAAVLNAPTNLNWSLWNGASFSAVASVFSGATTINSNDWGACVDSNGKVHCVRRTAATTYEHRIYSAGAWGAGATIPAQASLGTSGGVPLVADASGNVYLAVLTASPGAVKYIKYNGSAWDGSWSTLESSSATRAYLTVVPQVVNNQLVWLWTEGASSPFSVNGEALTLVTSHALAASATGGGTATAQLTVDHLLTASATGGASATAQLTVKHNLTASATAGASATALLTVKHPLQASATGGASASAQVTVAHHLTASATCGGSATAVLTVVGPHHLAASATGGGTATALLTVKHLLAASATAGASATAQLTIQHQLSAAATAGATATVKLTIQHQLSASASAGATALATLLILHHLFASAPAGGTATALLTHLSTTVLLTPSGTLSAGVVPLGSAATGSAPSGIMAAQPLPAGGISDGTTPGGTIAVGTTPAGAIVRE
jgi:hypothetical protein